MIIAELIEKLKELPQEGEIFRFQFNAYYPCTVESVNNIEIFSITKDEEVVDKDNRGKIDRKVFVII